jgi:hypothetical protein
LATRIIVGNGGICARRQGLDPAAAAVPAEESRLHNARQQALPGCPAAVAVGPTA